MKPIWDVLFWSQLKPKVFFREWKLSQKNFGFVLNQNYTKKRGFFVVSNETFLRRFILVSIET